MSVENENCQKQVQFIVTQYSIYSTVEHDCNITVYRSKHCYNLQLKFDKYNVYKICRQTQLSTRWYANSLNVNLNYMFRPQSLAIIRLYKRKLIN